VAVSPDGTRVLTASNDRTVVLWDVQSSNQAAVLRGHDGPVDHVEFSPDGSRILTVSGDGGGLPSAAAGTARLSDTRTGEVLAVFSAHDPIDDDVQISEATFSSDDERVATQSFFSGVTQLWDARTGREVAAVEGQHGRLLDRPFNPDGSRLA